MIAMITPITTSTLTKAATMTTALEDDPEPAWPRIVLSDVVTADDVLSEKSTVNPSIEEGLSRVSCSTGIEGVGMAAEGDTVGVMRWLVVIGAAGLGVDGAAVEACGDVVCWAVVVRVLAVTCVVGCADVVLTGVVCSVLGAGAVLAGVVCSVVGAGVVLAGVVCSAVGAGVVVAGFVVGNVVAGAEVVVGIAVGCCCVVGMLVVKGAVVCCVVGWCAEVVVDICDVVSWGMVVCSVIVGFCVVACGVVSCCVVLCAVVTRGVVVGWSVDGCAFVVAGIVVCDMVGWDVVVFLIVVVDGILVSDVVGCSFVVKAAVVVGAVVAWGVVVCTVVNVSVVGFSEVGWGVVGAVVGCVVTGPEKKDTKGETQELRLRRASSYRRLSILDISISNGIDTNGTPREKIYFLHMIILSIQVWRSLNKMGWRAWQNFNQRSNASWVLNNLWD